MKQNGFTLIELIGVIAILALILVVSIPKVMSTMTASTVKSYDKYKNDLESAAQTYVENNWSSFKNEFINANQNDLQNGKYCIPISILIENGYVSNTEIDPSTNEKIKAADKYILLNNVSSSDGYYRFDFVYVDSADSNDVNANECGDGV